MTVVCLIRVEYGCGGASKREEDGGFIKCSVGSQGLVEQKQLWLGHTFVDFCWLNKKWFK